MGYEKLRIRCNEELELGKAILIEIGLYGYELYGKTVMEIEKREY